MHIVLVYFFFFLFLFLFFSLFSGDSKRMGQNLDSMNQPRSKAELLFDLVHSTGNVEAIKLLFRDGASLEWTDKNGRNALMVACMNHNLIDAARTLIELGANINSYRPGPHAGTPLHHAAKEGLLQTVKLLLSNGANAFVRNDDGQTALDVAREKQHAYVVREIEKHICYFSGSVREIYGSGFLEYLLWRKIWVVVIPRGPNDPAKPLELDLAVYSTLKDARPYKVVSLSNARVEEPNLSQSDPKLRVFDDSIKSWLKLAPAIQGEKQQLQSLYNACRGISQAVEGAALAMASNESIRSASAESLPAPNSHPIAEASNSNGQGMSANNDSYSECWSAVGTTQSEPNSTGGICKQAKEAYNGCGAHDPEPRPLGNETKQSQTCGESTRSVSQNKIVFASVSSAPSAPLIPEEILAEGPIHYPSIDLDVDASLPLDTEASTSNHKKAENNSSLCVICFEAPLEGACVPCGHMAGCMSCLNEIKAKKGVCPVCRSKMNEVVRIYAV